MSVGVPRVLFANFSTRNRQNAILKTQQSMLIANFNKLLVYFDFLRMISYVSGRFRNAHSTTIACTLITC